MSDAPPADRPGFRARFRGLLAPGHWFYILGLLVPLMLVALFFQVIRLKRAGLLDGPLTLLDQLHSDIAFHLAVITFWVGAFALVRRRWSRRGLTLALHVAFSVLSLATIMTFLFFYQLDIMPNTASFQLVSLLFQVTFVQIIRTETNSVLVAVALVMALAANLFPLIANWWFRPRRLSVAPAEPRPATFTPRQIVLGTAVVMAALLGIAAVPNVTGATNFTRHRAVELPIEALEHEIQGEPDGYVAPTADSIPNQTSLAKTDRTKPYNVVLIVLESHGRVSTSLGNPELTTTPVLKKLAESSLEATRAFTVVPNTTKSLVTTNCGVAPPPDTLNSEAEPGGIAATCLARLLRGQGYGTAYFQSATRTFENREKVVEGFGFEHFFAEQSYDKTGFDPVNTLGYEDDIMLKPSLDWAKAQGDQPFFLEYLTVTAHTKYVMPKSFELEHYTDDEKQNHYLNGVRYQDRFVGKVIEGFEKAGLADNTIFAIVADHGEAFREHGRRLHSDVPWTEGLQIPWLIKMPGRFTEGEKVDHVVQNMSMLPTIVDLLGYDVTGGKYHASSILAPEDNPAPRVSSCWNVDQCLVYFPDDRHAYLYFFGYRDPEYYDLAKDPLEKDDIVDRLPEKTQQEYQELMLAWYAENRDRHELSRRLADD